MRSQNQQSGFSLAELMVVVAIIGILATVAIPRVNKFIAKARQSEAQVNLASLYTFNKNFFVEFQGYTNDFTAMGFSPEGKLRYNTGFAAGAAGPTNYLTLKGIAAYGGNTNSLAACPSDNSVAACVTLLGATNAEPSACVGALAANFSSFTAEAHAQLIDGAAEDIWTINQDKNLNNTSDGTQ